MKYLKIIPLLLIVFVSACFESEESRENSDESKEESVEASIKKGLYEQVMEIGGNALPEGDFKPWEQTRDVILALEDADLSKSDNSKKEIRKIFKAHGFKTYEEGYRRIEKSSRMINTILGIGLELASLETIELTKGKKEARRAEKEIIKKLQKKGYTQADIKGLDKYESTLGKSVDLLLKLPKPE